MLGVGVTWAGHDNGAFSSGSDSGGESGAEAFWSTVVVAVAGMAAAVCDRESHGFASKVAAEGVATEDCSIHKGGKCCSVCCCCECDCVEEPKEAVWGAIGANMLSSLEVDSIATGKPIWGRMCDVRSACTVCVCVVCTFRLVHLESEE